MECGDRLAAEALRKQSQRVSEFAGKSAGVSAVVVFGAAQKAATGVPVLTGAMCLLERQGNRAMGQWYLGSEDGRKRERKKGREWIVGAMGGVWYLREPGYMLGLWDGMCNW